MGYPLVGTRFREWKFTKLPIQYEGSHDGRMGVRLGPEASGVGSHYATSARPTPPGVGTTAVRRSAQVPSQVGFPPTVRADASPGQSRMANRSACVATRHCEAGEFISVQLVGATTRARSAPRADIAQRVKVGYWPRRTHAAHVAIPPTFALGDLRRKSSRVGVAEKWRAASLWSICRMPLYSRAPGFPRNLELGCAVAAYVHSVAQSPQVSVPESDEGT